MKVKDAPLLQACQFSGLDGELQVGVHIATILSDSGLQEYLIVYDPVSDKVMGFEKLYMNPEDPSDFRMEGIANPHLLNEIGGFCRAEGLFDHLPERQEYDGEDEGQDTD